MAPLPPPDDFVLTLSDAEQDDGSSADEQVGAALAVSQDKKRKRGVTDEQSRGKSKKTKGSNSKLRSASRMQDGSDGGQDDNDMNPDFDFQIEGQPSLLEDFDGWDGTALQDQSTAKKGVDIDALIAKRKARHPNQEEPLDDGEQSDEDSAGEAEVAGIAADLDPRADDVDLVEEDESDDELLAPDAFGMGATLEGSEGSDDADDSEASDNDSVASPMAHPDDASSATDESSEHELTAEEQARQKAYFAPESQDLSSASLPSSLTNSFQSMSLSRPILRGLQSVGFVEPTPIQNKTIPLALLGKDIVGGAVTGSGKTAAFIVPILERLLYRPRKVPSSRVAILMPTRELAVQCFQVARKLASFTDITFCQLVGGFSLREQETTLRSRPDVIIATPGRFIDHMRNSASFTIETLEILVLDEADRMLEDGFADELNEILKTLPKSRQTMLFSATMTDSVDKLIRVGLNRPVRLLVDPQKSTVETLTQEFVRLRPGREEKRLASLLQLCATTYATRCIIFFRQKKEVHRVRILFALLGFKVAELHGSMTQEQRIRGIESFRAGTVTHLLATDVASRGLDIKGVEAVINFEAPQTHEIYLHRVGRTARAGRAGRACTLAAEPDRKIVRAAVRSGRAHGARIVSRVLDTAAVDEWARKSDAMDEEVEAVLSEERMEKQLGQADMQVRKGENLMTHAKEIHARPRRTWFESERDKQMAKDAGRRALNGDNSSAGVSAVKSKKSSKTLSGKDRKRLDDRKQRLEGKTWRKSKSSSMKGAPGKAKNGAKSNGKAKSAKAPRKAKQKFR